MEQEMPDDARPFFRIRNAIIFREFFPGCERTEELSREMRRGERRRCARAFVPRRGGFRPPGLRASARTRMLTRARKHTETHTYPHTHAQSHAHAHAHARTPTRARAHAHTGD